MLHLRYKIVVGALKMEKPPKQTNSF